MKVCTSLRGMPCIYKITNLIDFKIYVGKAKCLVNRSYNYNSSFKQERHDHINDYMFNAMIKHGFKNFKIEPIEFCLLEELAERELYWIKFLKSNDRNIGYNLRLDSSSGMTTSLETSFRISENLINQWESGVRDGHGDKLKETWNRNPERRIEASKHFTKVLTKYLYIVTDKNGVSNTYNYKQLQELKLDRILVKFWKWKYYDLPFKGFQIKRISI